MLHMSPNETLSSLALSVSNGMAFIVNATSKSWPVSMSVMYIVGPPISALVTVARERFQPAAENDSKNFLRSMIVVSCVTISLQRPFTYLKI